MYYLDEIMDRTFETWGSMLGANDLSFWATSEIEMKPTPHTDTNTTTPTETPAWEAADTNEWQIEVECADDAIQVTETSGEPTAPEVDETCQSNPASSAIYNLTDTVRDSIEGLQPTDERGKD